MELTDLAIHHPTWVQQGEDFHRLETKLWQRRNLSRFKLMEGTIHHNLTVRDNHLGMHGIVDMAIETDEAVYAVEFKLSANKKKRGAKLQLAAYAMLLEKRFSKPSSTGFLVGKGKVVHTLTIDTDTRESVMGVVDEIKQMLQRGLKPESSATIYQCCTCEYINFCNDRV